MHQSNEHKARPRLGRGLGIAAALLCATALSQPNLAYAGPHGGGGGGRFPRGRIWRLPRRRNGWISRWLCGYARGRIWRVSRGGFHGDRFHDGRFGRDRFRDNRFFFGGAFAYPYEWDYSPDYGYYDYSQPYSSQTWYYCSDPAGYYPYVTQCNTGWQAVAAN